MVRPPFLALVKDGLHAPPCDAKLSSEAQNLGQLVGPVSSEQTTRCFGTFVNGRTDGVYEILRVSLCRNEICMGSEALPAMQSQFSEFDKHVTTNGVSRHASTERVGLPTPNRSNPWWFRQIMKSRISRHRRLLKRSPGQSSKSAGQQCEKMTQEGGKTVKPRECWKHQYGPAPANAP